MQGDTFATLRDLLIGAWRCNSSGTTTDLLLGDDGRYINTSDAGLTQHWGMWSLEPATSPSGVALAFHLHGAVPQSWHAPTGAITIAWPQSERWPIIDVTDERVTVPGVILQRLSDTVRNNRYFEEGTIPR